MVIKTLAFLKKNNVQCGLETLKWNLKLLANFSYFLFYLKEDILHRIHQRTHLAEAKERGELEGELKNKYIYHKVKFW